MKQRGLIRNTGVLLVIYTILFCVLAAGIFWLFAQQGRSFLYEGDALDQGYFWTVEMKNSLASLTSGDGWPLWSWARGMGLDMKLPSDPFMLIAALFPMEKIEIGYTVAIVLRLYFAGLAFIAFALEVKLDRFAALAGALCYVSSTWVINLALMQGQYINILIMFPLLALSVDRIYKGKSPFLFMLCVGITVAVNFYLAYMSAIAIIMYILLRWFTYNSGEGFGAYILNTLKFMLYGIIGIVISAAFVLTTVQMLSGASTGSGTAIEYLYDMDHYKEIALKLLSCGYAVSYSEIGIPFFALLTIFAFKGKPSIKATHMIMTVILFAMTLFPVCGSIFNGFSYNTNRWYFLLIFFAVWSAAEHMDFESLAEPRNIVIMSIWWIILTAATLGFSYFDITGDLSLAKAEFMGGNLAAGFVMILFLAVAPKIIKSLAARETLTLLAIIGALVITWNCTLEGHMDYFLENGQVYDMLSRSTQRAGSQIDDDGFYRIDQVDWINFTCKADQPANENLRWQNNTIYLYDSKIPSRLSLFNKYVGNNLGYSKRVYVQSNGERMGLDFLYGVKYFLGNDPENDKTASSAYAGYGFEKDKDIDGVEVFKNKYDSGLGFTYDKYISESEFLKLSRLEREQALLQAVVIPDEECDAQTLGKEIKASDIKTDIRDIPYTFKGTEGDVTYKDGVIQANEDKTVVILYAEEEVDGQLIVSFDNLRRYNADGKEVGDFYVSCANYRLTSGASNGQNNQTIPGIVDFDLNMGYYDYYAGNLRIHLNKKGTYKFDKLYVSAMSAENYDTYAKERVKGSYRVSEQTSSKVTGTVDAPKDGILFISLPVHDNWDLYIDGEKAEVTDDANIAFMSAGITKGKHEVELRYNTKRRMMMAAISLAGLIAAAIVSLIDRRMKKRRSGNKGDDDFWEQ